MEDQEAFDQWVDKFRPSPVCMEAVQDMIEVATERAYTRGQLNIMETLPWGWSKRGDRVMNKFNPPLEVSNDLRAWMTRQSRSAFVGDMLRAYDRKGGLTEQQIKWLEEMKEKS